jgi:hypothetical protein
MTLKRLLQIWIGLSGLVTVGLFLLPVQPTVVVYDTVTRKCFASHVFGSISLDETAALCTDATRQRFLVVYLVLWLSFVPFAVLTIRKHRGSRVSQDASI